MKNDSRQGKSRKIISQRSRDAEIGRKRSVFYFLPQRLCERSSVSSYLGELREIIFTLLGEKGVHLRGEFRDVVFVVLACRGTRETDVDVAHVALLVEQDCRRITVDTREHRQLVADVVGFRDARHENREVDLQIAPIAAYRSGRFLEIAMPLEHERDDLEPFVLVLAIEGHEEPRFVVTVRAPRPADRDEHDLVLKALVAER